MKKNIFILLAMLVLGCAIGTTQIKQNKPKTAKPKTEQPKIKSQKQPSSTSLGKTTKREATTCKTCGVKVKNCRYRGNHPICSDCGKIIDNCSYGGNHPKCSDCGKIVDECTYGGNHPKCSDCGKLVEECEYKGNHPKCNDCGKSLENCDFHGNHAVVQKAIDDMVYVQGGTFNMGGKDGKPVHKVTLSDFQISKYEVTQALWLAVMGTTVSQQRDKADKSNTLYGVGDNYPMYYVSWEEWQEFVERLNRITGKRFRLPTEAEWEYAARGGNRSKGYKYAGSNKINNVAWYLGNMETMVHTYPVGTKAPNELGLYDMSGNVGEWCQDWLGDYSSSSQINPTGPSSGSYRVCRGGTFTYDARGCRVSYRDGGKPSVRSREDGLRLAL